MWSSQIEKPKSNCGACDNGIPTRTGGSIVFHNGLGLCKNNLHTVMVESRVARIMSGVKPNSPFAEAAIQKPF